MRHTTTEPETAPAITPRARRAAGRSKIIALASRGRLPSDLPPNITQHLDDDVLLDDVTRAARDAVLGESTLTQAVVAACAGGLDRDEVVEAIRAGGYSESRARGIVSSVWVASGQRKRARGAGRETPAPAIKVAAYAHEMCADDWGRAEKFLRAATRYAHQQREIAARALAKSAA